ncbi:MAG: O-antigen ligase family protein [Solirubrobacteraceae bacterium]
MPVTIDRDGLRADAPSLVPGLIAVALMLIWAVHDGGYDPETWYWGGLVIVALLTASLTLLGGWERLDRRRLGALVPLAAYTAACYLSIDWAGSPGDALQGANQALVYLALFALLLTLPWTARAALVTLTMWVGGVGVIAVVLLFRLASADHVQALVIEGRLAAPTGYFNSTAALFTMGALAAIALAARRDLSGPLRGLLAAFACAGLQLALIVQSRGWLFTLPIVALLVLAVAKDRLRLIAAAVIPALGTVAILHRLLGVYQASTPSALSDAAARAGRPALMILAGVFVCATLLAWADALVGERSPSAGRRRLIGGTLAALAVAGVILGGTAATHGHPLRFISRQWNGFSHPQTSFSTHSHFGDVGSSRYDFWRVSLDGFVAHPIGGLGEDNFADFYLRHRRTVEEPSSTHSLWLRLLAQTGIVGFLLFVGFLAAALRLALSARRRCEAPIAALAAAELVPLIVWLVHGSIDWFWEMPALTGPALGFLAIAGALRDPVPAPRPARATARSRSRIAAGASAAALSLVAAVVALGLPYLSLREVSLATAAVGSDPRAALADFATAASLNPLSSLPGRLAGVTALSARRFREAERRFQESMHREPGAWFPWLGAGLAASALGDRVTAARDFRQASVINSTQPADQQALRRVYSTHPLTPSEAFSLLVVR